MADPQRFVHLLVADRTENREFNRGGGGNPKIADVERRAHGIRVLGEAENALTTQDALRVTAIDELESIGVVITIEGTVGFPLRLDSLERRSNHRDTPRPKWLLLSVTPEAGDQPERALVWVSDEYRATFLKLIEDYLDKPAKAGSDKPRNRELVANIGRIQASVLRDLWQSAGEPHRTGTHWWEIWLQPTDDAISLLERFANALQLRISSRRLLLEDRHVAWVRSSWTQLQSLPATAVPIAEIRYPLFVDSLEDLQLGEQIELTEDLVERLTVAPTDAPAVCLIDTGVRRTHLLIEGSLDESDMHTVIGPPSGDTSGHGTQMAGLALFGSLEPPLTGTSVLQLDHRLESVKMIPGDQPSPTDPAAYGLVTAQAVAAPETVAGRRRTFCLTITDVPDRPGEPSLWSAALDALAAGTDIGQANGGISLLGPPDRHASRLVVVAAGNVDPPFHPDHLGYSDASPIEDPAQAWNVLTVGAYTDLDSTPTDPTFDGWSTLAAPGELSPHSRTGVGAGGSAWPIKPDICMEGGNLLTDGNGDTSDHPSVALPTTGHRDDGALTTTNATSAATAQAARLATLAMVRYPAYWPETVRGLLTHGAHWTEPMRAAIAAETQRKKRRQLLRRYGWGVPTAESVLTSSNQAVTMVVQDEFVPFTGPDHKMREFRLHQLPWPVAQLQELGDADVELRITLSYFIEPSASRRGWRRRYAYASHGLRFDLRSPDETTTDFVKRVNREAATEENQGQRPDSGADKWTVGVDQRSKGSLHQDVWSGYGAQLARSGGVVAVHAVGGWWKNNKRKDRADLPVRYALLVSLRTSTEDIDLYTPVATELAVPIEAAAIEI